MDIESLPPLREIIAQHDLRASKKLGQNFLLDLNITDKIVRQAGDLTGVNVVEIGPGPGGLTRSLLMAGAQSVTAIEFDPRAVAALQSLQDAAQGRLRVIEGDAMVIDPLEVADAPRMIVANLPYNIATPLLVRWLAHIHADPGAYQGMALMFQREVADRICAAPGAKAYGRLGVLSQWLCDAHRVVDLPPGAFTPPPKVSSAVVRFVPKAAQEDRAPFSVMEKITAAAFGQRRKMIRSSLKLYADALAECGIDDTQRAEELSVSDYDRLSRAAAQI